jgi:S-adenosylmethionine:tRNA ribosyltransferase-isomerase
MKTSDFDYELPEALIADQPPQERGASRLLVLDTQTGSITDQEYGDVASYVQPGDVVVLNDTKVIPARLQVAKQPGDQPRELILLEKHGRQDDWHRHKVLYRRSLAAGDKLQAADGTELTVVETLGDGIAVISSPADLLELAARVGTVPLPPYMHRPATDADRERYQTIWAREAGSVAAPTASLNMTGAMLAALQAKGAIVCYATLHVGLGTFLPIRSDEVAGHVMHREYFEIPESTVAAIQQAKQAGREIWAVGTTITRTLEYAAGQILHQPAAPISGEADIFIYPGYAFQLVDNLLTNFHAPRSTVLMMAAAFAGWEQLLRAYHHAVKAKYHFLSYGDSMLITAHGRTGREL